MAGRMRVAVTGGSGKVGRAAIAALREAGHRVVNFDLRPSPDGVRTVVADFADFGTALGALSGVDTAAGVPDAVLHLAGIPAPGLAPDHVIFQNNVLSTYNVLSACRRLGIRRIVWASSETVLGLPFTEPPAYAPVDEAHGDRPNWSYALSKSAGEHMADQFARWDKAASITSLRFSNVFTPEEYAGVPAMQAKPETRQWNLWGYVDARDCGTACLGALERALPGHERFIIAAADTLMAEPSADLMARYFPGVPVRELPGPYASLLSSARAEGMLGWRAEHSWRDRV